MEMKNNNLIKPHGGVLKSLIIPKDKRKKEIEKGNKLFKIKLNSLEFSDLIMLGIGAFSPLEGFMFKSDYYNVLNKGKLTNGELWPIPITLAITETEKKKVIPYKDIALISPDSDEIVGLLRVKDIFKADIRLLNLLTSLWGRVQTISI